MTAPTLPPPPSVMMTTTLLEMPTALEIVPVARIYDDFLHSSQVPLDDSTVHPTYQTRPLYASPSS